MLKKIFYGLRKLLFKNKAGEVISIFASNFLGTKLIVPHHQYELKTYRLAKRNGLNLKLDVSNEVDHFIYFKKKDTSFDNLLEEIKEAKTILDIGGNIGAFALFFEKLNPSSTIYSFEPHPYTFSRLQENLQLNNSRIHACNIGLGDSRSSLKMYEIDSHNIGMNKIFKEEQDYPFVTVEVETLDEFWGKKGSVDFIKIDVEGFEYSVLKGAEVLLTSFFPVLVIEIDDNNLRSNGTSARELIGFLQSAGYDYIMNSDKKASIDQATDFENCHFDIIVKKLNQPVSVHEN